MKDIAKFFTIFWIIYFPTCIAYNEMSFFSSFDELMTVILLLYTYTKKNKQYTNRGVWKEFNVFWGILAFYVVYGLLFGANVAVAVFYDLIQQVRPWAVIYCTWILNPQFSKKQKKWMLGTMVATLVSFVLYHPDVASNVMAGTGNRNAPFGQLAISASMAWYLFTGQTRRNLHIATAIAIVGLMGMKFKYYGQFGAWMFMLYYMKSKFNFKSAKTYVSLTLLFIVVIGMGWERFDAYYVTGMNQDDLARPLMNKAMVQMLWDYFPFGSGLGSFADLAATKYYSPIWAKYGLDHVWGLQQYGQWGNCGMAFHGDNFIATFGQIGVVGIVLFYAFWKRRVKAIVKIVDMRYYKVACMAFFCIAIEWFGDSSYLSGKGMGYLMILGLCLNSNRNNGYADEGMKMTDLHNPSQGIEENIASETK